MSEKLYTTKQAAEYTGDTAQAIKKDAQRGHMGTKLGRDWVFTEAELDDRKKRRRQSKTGTPQE